MNDIVNMLIDVMLNNIPPKEISNDELDILIDTLHKNQEEYTPVKLKFYNEIQGKEFVVKELTGYETEERKNTFLCVDYDILPEEFPFFIDNKIDQSYRINDGIRITMTPKNVIQVATYHSE